MSLRLVHGVFVALVAGAVATQACGGDSPSPSTSPAQVPTTTPAPAGPSYTISGVVYDNTPSGRRPIAGVVLNVISANDVVTHAVTATSDSLGHYDAPAWGDVATIAPVLASTYMAPCPAGTDYVGENPNRSFDVDVVSSSILSTSGLPDSYQTSGAVWLAASGTVTEPSAQGPRPVSGALVELGADSTGAYLGSAIGPGSIGYSATLTDASGNYLVCTSPRGSGSDQPFPLTVKKTGYAAAGLVVYPGWNSGGAGIGGSGYNVTLVRQQ